MYEWFSGHAKFLFIFLKIAWLIYALQSLLQKLKNTSILIQLKDINVDYGGEAWHTSVF